MAALKYITQDEDCGVYEIDLFNNTLTDSELAELIDYLLIHPDVVTFVWLRGNQLTDETGVKLAQYVTASSTVQILNLVDNQFSDATYLAMAKALRVNTSLQILDLLGNQAVDKTLIDAAFVEALRLNPNRSDWSRWWLYSLDQDDFERLEQTAEQLGHPTLQELICARCLGRDHEEKKRSLE